MKKKVRIYKSPTGKGEFINKTAQFLQRAQMGGMPDPATMGYPGAAEEEVSSEDQIAQSIISDIQNGRPKEETVVKLVNSFNQDPMTADQYYEQIFNALKSQQQELEDEEVSGVEEENTDQQTQVEDEVASQEIEDDWIENKGTDAANQMLAEDDESIAAEDLGEAESQLVMQDGGMMPTDFDMSMYENRYPVQYAGLSAFLPQTMLDDNASFAQPMSGELDEEFKKGGAYRKAKSKYVKTILGLNKKVDGGPQAVEESADPTGANVRNNRLKQFVSTLKTNSDYAQAKEQAEQEFEQLALQQQQMQMQMQQQMQMPPNSYMQNGGEQDIYNGQDYENPMHHLQLYSHAAQDVFGDPMNQTTQAQNGIQVGNNMGNIRMPKGVMGMPPITKMDVRRSGLFGRPKEYSVEFGQSPMPGMPGAGVGFYGYGATATPPKKKSPGRIFTEKATKEVNKQATTEVAAATPASEAAQKSAEATSQTAASSGTTSSNLVEEAAYPETVSETPVTTPTAANKLFTVPGKSGYYYRQRADGSYVKFKGDPSKHTSSTAPVKVNGKAVYITPKDPTYKYLNTKAQFANEYDPNAVAAAVTPNTTADQKKINALLKKSSKQLTPEERRLVIDYKKKQMNASIKAIPSKVKSYYQAPNSSLISNIVPAAARATEQFKDFFYRDSGYEEGGAIMDPQMDPYGNLQQFVYGGNDMSIPQLSQEDIDYMNSKDTTDGYFQYGGLTTYVDKGEVKSDAFEDYRKQVGDKLNMSLREDLSAKELFEMGNKAGIGFGQKPAAQQQMQYPSYDPFAIMNMMANAGRGGRGSGMFPANLAGSPQYYGKIKKGPYNPLTGAGVSGGFGPNTNLKSINVTKTGMFGRPKKYTMTYGNPEMDPRKQNLITLPGEGVEGYAGQASPSGNQDRLSNTQGLKLGTRAKITAKELFGRRGQDDPYASQQDVMNQEPADNTGGGQDQDEVKRFQAQQEAKGLVYDDIENKWIPKVTGQSAKDAGSDLMAQSRADMEIATSGKLPIPSGQGELDKLRAQRQSVLEGEMAQGTQDRERATMGPVGFPQDNALSPGQMEIDQDIQARQQELNLEKSDAQDQEMGIGFYDPEYNPNQFGQAGLEELQKEDQRMQGLMNESDLQDQQDGTGIYDSSFGNNFGQAGMNALVQDRQQKAAAAAKIAAARATAAKRNVVTPQGRGSMTGPSNNQAATIPSKNNQQNQDLDVDTAQYLSNQERTQLQRAQQERNSPQEQTKVNKQKQQEEKQKLANMTELEKSAYKAKDKIKNVMGADYKTQYDKPLQVLNNRREYTFKLIDQRQDLTTAQKKQKKQGVWDQYYAEQNKLDQKWAETQKQYQEAFSYQPARTKGSSPKKPFDVKVPKYFSNGGMLPKAVYGNNPVTYTDNPALAGMTDVQMITLNPGIQGLSGGTNWGQLSATNTVTQGNGVGEAPTYGASAPTAPSQPDGMIVGKESQQVEKEYAPPEGDVSIDVKNKRMGEFDPEAWLNTGNAAIRGLTKFIGNDEDTNMYDDYNSDNMFGASNTKDRGDYVQYGQRLGMFRDPEEGQKRTGRTKQYGGAMNVDDEIYMTDEEIEDFLANGGSLEYL
jgi:ribonuclease HII